MDDFKAPILYDRVTQILYPFSGMMMIHPITLQSACIRGTDVHNIIESLQDGIPVGFINESLQGYIDSYNLWSLGKKFIEKPKRFYNDKLNITGECDCIYRDGKDLVLVDFKTSICESKTWKYQGSAYSFMAKEKGYEITKIEFVKLSKEGRQARSYFYEEDMDHFKILLAVYREFFKNNKFDMEDL